KNHQSNCIKSAFAHSGRRKNEDVSFIPKKSLISDAPKSIMQLIEIQNVLEKSLIPSFSFSQALQLVSNKLCKH
ncbi:5029_t:CDS:2, partial [Entrophospora sp. SA101]